MKYIKTFESFGHEEIFKSADFIKKRKELIEFITGPIGNYNLAFEQFGESQLVDSKGDGELDTEMMKFKAEDENSDHPLAYKGNFIIFAGVNFNSNGELKYFVTIKNKNDEVILEPTTFNDIKELKITLNDIIDDEERGGTGKKPFTIKTYG